MPGPSYGGPTPRSPLVEHDEDAPEVSFGGQPGLPFAAPYGGGSDRGPRPRGGERSGGPGSSYGEGGRAAAPSTAVSLQRVAVLADVPSLQRSAKKHFGRVLSYSRILATALRGRGCVRAVAFLAERDVNDAAFLNHLRQSGFEIRRIEASDRGDTRSTEPLGSLPIEAMRVAERVDVVVLAGSDGQLLPIVSALRTLGCRVELTGIEEATPDELRESVDGFAPVGREELFGERS